MRALFAATLAFAAACSTGVGDDDNPGDDDDDDDDQPTIDASVGECTPANAGGFQFEKIATWLDDATAAYSMIHDDMCGPSLHGIYEEAVPALAARGLAAGLAPIVEECNLADLWSVVLDAEAKGNEIVSHSYTHPEINAGNIAREVDEAKAEFDSHLANPITFYVFPYDYFTPQTIAAVGAAGHLGARAGNRDDNDGFDAPPINSKEPTADLEVEFDAWPRNYSKYALFFPEEILTVHVYNAIEKGGWALREFHSVIADGSSTTDQGFGPITRTQYDAHLKFLADARKKGVLWTAPPSTVLKYRHARSACGASVEGDLIHFDIASADCVKYATPISVIVTAAEDLPRVDAVQAGAPVWSRKLGPRRYSITADPTKGDVQLTGCSNPGYEIDPTIDLTPKPTPAASVCLIETVTGSGGDGSRRSPDRAATARWTTSSGPPRSSRSSPTRRSTMGARAPGAGTRRTRRSRCRWARSATPAPTSPRGAASRSPSSAATVQAPATTAARTRASASRSRAASPAPTSSTAR
jgi:hypothetical protein